MLHDQGGIKKDKTAAIKNTGKDYMKGGIMKQLEIENDMLDFVVEEMGKSELFGALNHKSRVQIADISVLNQYEPEDIIVNMNDPSDSCFMIIKGEVSILHASHPDDEIVELGRRTPYNTIGEIGFLLNQPRNATVMAVETTLMLEFDNAMFNHMFGQIPGFGRIISQVLATRLQETSTLSFLPMYDEELDYPTEKDLQLLPIDFITRHNILPLGYKDDVLRIGLVHTPKSSEIRTVMRLLPGVQLKFVHITKEILDDVLKSQAGISEWKAPVESPQKAKKATVGKTAPQLDPLLKRMIAEGASDLHLSAGRVPYWRIDGEIRKIDDAKAIGEEEVLNILNPVMDEHSKQEFNENNDADLIYGGPGGVRFRVNLFRDRRGIGTTIRLIPSTILPIKQLGLPPVLEKFCKKPKGLVLVSGPTCSGKSTTLAAMIDYINKTRRVHIITMEDPIEFVHREELALIHQRHVGHHTNTFTSALRSALREDPDILLVGELRDQESVARTLEAANTGSLVFGTLQTATAISTITRIIDFFPPDRQPHVRSSLADSLQGIVSQTLCKRVGGGRIVAAEVLIVNAAVRNLIREEKFNQILSAMQAGKAVGNRLLNEELADLVKGKKVGREMHRVEYLEALNKTHDPDDLARRLGKSLPKD